MNRRSFLHGIAGALLGVPVVIKEGAGVIDGVGVIRYPAQRAYSTGDLSRMRQAARELADHIKPGSIIGLPSDRDQRGEYLWDFKIEGGDPGQVKIERQEAKA